MIKRLVFMTVLFVLLPCVVFGQWEFFEHRYKYKLSDVLKAERFVKKDGYWEGYSKDNKLVGYVFLSKDWTKDLVGYSGKHMETLIGMDTKGKLTGVKVIFHSEPIVLIGLKEDNYKKFIEQYPGKSIEIPLRVGKEISMDAITGATVTAVVQNAIILGSAKKVATKVGILKAKVAKKHRKISNKYTKLSWKELLKSGAVKHLKISYKELGLKGKGTYLDVYFGLVNPPAIGRNVIGDRAYADIMKRLKKGQSAIFVFGKGKGSFKGSGYARGGVFDRFNIEQGSKVYVFRDKDYRIMTDIYADGAPAIKEGGVFIIRSTEFDPTQPFKFNLILPYRIGGKKMFKSFTVQYSLPESLMEE